jgi:osmoprotectant transport system substrate-binding protein
MNRMPVVSSLLLVAVLGLAGCGGGDDTLKTDTSGDSAGGSVVVGSANFPENELLAEIYAGALKAAGVDATTKPNIGAREAYIKGIEDGSIDMIPEYTGNLRLYFNEKATASDPAGVYKELKAALPDSLTVLDYAEAQDKDAVVVTKETADKYSLTSIGDLAPVAGDLVLGGPPEWKTRSTGEPGLKKVYGVTFKDFVELDAGGPLTLDALVSGRVDAGNLFTTDPNLADKDLVVLQDPKSLFASQNVVPLVRTDAVNATVTKTLNDVSAHLDTKTLGELRTQVEIDKKDPEQVAAGFLSKAGLG